MTDNDKERNLLDQDGPLNKAALDFKAICESSVIYKGHPEIEAIRNILLIMEPFLFDGAAKMRIVNYLYSYLIPIKDGK